MKLSVSRVVVLFSPIFVAASAVGLAWVAKHFPGLPKLNASDVVVLEVAGATAAITAVLKWLHGWSLWERLVKTLDPVALPVIAAVKLVDPNIASEAAKVVTGGVAAVANAIDPPPAEAFPPPALVPPVEPAPVVA